ncbi:hypothetical protein IFM89_005933 [Coptis chinensis]|uniref:Uncharacterized protein n=1 Tax=Coptis chinensis TaxID=261450 RepID=A0A835M1Q6_9MAGN|nr:hypothetical protein IFM89_005933 [Coptis chinensis]
MLLLTWNTFGDLLHALYVVALATLLPNVQVLQLLLGPQDLIMLMFRMRHLQLGSQELQMCRMFLLLCGFQELELTLLPSLKRRVIPQQSHIWGLYKLPPLPLFKKGILPLSDRPSLHSILGSSPLSLRASGSPSAFIRDRSNALRPSSSFSGRGMEVESNTYVALALDEDGIEDDISENQEDPFGDQCVNTPLISRLSMPSQVTTRA